MKLLLIPKGAPIDPKVGAPVVVCDQVNEVDAVHEVDKVDDVHQVDPVHQVHGNDEVRVIKQVGNN